MIRSLLEIGSEEWPEAFDLAKRCCDNYEAALREGEDPPRRTMSALEKYDFRRGFEIGYYRAKGGGDE